MFTEQEFRVNFLLHERPEKIRNARLTALVAAVLIAFGFILDYFIYPDYFREFLGIRLLATCLSIIIYFVIRNEYLSEPQKMVCAHFLPLPPMLMICYMIFRTEGINSTYYAGLNLILVGLVVALKWSPLFSIFMSIVLVALYTLSICLSDAGVHLDNAVNNYFFLFTNAILVAFGAYFYESTRISEYRFQNELQEQSKVLEEANEKLKDLDKAKTDFFANVSHELRTPLTIILGNSDRLISALGENTHKGLVLPLRDNALRLLKLIDNLLDLVRFDQGEVREQKSSIDVIQFLDNFCLQVTPLVDRKGLMLIKDWDHEVLQVSVDEEKLEKILNNLVINSIKFTSVGGNIRISAQYVDQHLQLGVEDNGVGMSKDSVDKIFTRFWQVKSGSNRKFRGTGIGLNLVQNLVKSMGGEIKVDSQLNEGTKFTIRIPVDETLTTPSQNETHEEGVIEAYHKEASYTVSGMEYQTERNTQPLLEKDPNRKLILVADDETELRTFIIECLSETYQVIGAKDGWEALELGRQYKPDLFVIDYMMPEMDGLELTKRIQNSARLKQKPTLMLTARADHSMKLKALETGVLDFLPKPFSPIELNLRVKNILQQEEYRLESDAKRVELKATLEKLQESEAKLVQQEKLAALGRMSAGLIHEINNPLNYAKTASSLLERKLKAGKSIEPDEGLDYLDDISEGVDRVVKIVADLRNFATNSPKDLQRNQLLAIIENAQKMVADQLEEHDITMSIDIKPEIDVLSNDLQLSQVFINMFQNSILAIMERKKEASHQGEIRVTAREFPDQVVLTLWDNGCGIPQEKKELIFDPFYTSRDVGEGMGLGLSIVKQLLQTSQAELDVDSTPNEFTEFTILFQNNHTKPTPS